MCLYFSYSKNRCVLCCRSSGQGDSWRKQPWSCRIQHRPRRRGEQLSAPTWLWSCLRMYYTYSHRVNCLASWQNEEHEGNYTHDPHRGYIHHLPKDRHFMPVSHIAPFSCVVINIIWMFNILFELALCIAVCVYRWWAGVGSAVCLALRARVGPW